MRRLRARNAHSLRDSTPTHPTGLHSPKPAGSITATAGITTSPTAAPPLPGSERRRRRCPAAYRAEPPSRGTHLLPGSSGRLPRSPLTPPPRAAGFRTPGAARGGEGRAGRRAGLSGRPGRPAAAGRGRAALTPAGCTSSSSQRRPPGAVPVPLRAGAVLAAFPAPSRRSPPPQPRARPLTSCCGRPRARSAPPPSGSSRRRAPFLGVSERGERRYPIPRPRTRGTPPAPLALPLPSSCWPGRDVQPAGLRHLWGRDGPDRLSPAAAVPLPSRLPRRVPTVLAAFTIRLV